MKKSALLLSTMALCFAAAAAQAATLDTKSIPIHLTVGNWASVTISDPCFDLNLATLGFDPAYEDGPATVTLSANIPVILDISQSWSGLATAMGISQALLLWDPTDATEGPNWVISPSIYNSGPLPSGLVASSFSYLDDNAQYSGVGMRFTMAAEGTKSFALKIGSRSNKFSPNWPLLTPAKALANPGVLTLTVSNP